MASYIDKDECLQCGVCVAKCPSGAIIAEDKITADDLVLQPVHIDPEICTDCGTCVSEEYWCPGGAIVRG